MSYLPDKYVPASNVVYANSIPRFNYESTSMTDANKFPGSMKEASTFPSEYLNGVVTLPVILMVVGVLSIFIFQICIMCRCCFKCFKCAPKEDDIATDPESVIKSRNRVFYFFWFFMLLMLVADHFLYFGDADINTGRDNVIKSLKLLKGIFTSIKSSVDNLVANNAELKIATASLKGAKGGNCNSDAGANAALTSMDNATAAMLTAFTGLQTLVSKLPDMIQTFIDSVTTFGADYKNYAMYALYGLVLSINLIFMGGSCLASKCIMWIGLLVGEFTCIISTLVCGVVMIVVTVYGDFCMNPGVNMQGIVGPGSASDMLGYFSTCVGTDPFVGNIDTAQSGLNSFQQGLNDIKTASCGADSDVITNADDAITGMTTALSGIKISTTCQAMYPVYNTFMNKALCTNMFDGVWKIWLCGCVVSISLFCVMCCSSVMWQYFGVPWKLRPTDVHTGTHGHLTGTGGAHTAVATYEAPDGYKQEYTFTAASPSAPTLTRKEIEMI